MIRILYRPAAGAVQTGLSLSQLKPALQDAHGLLWVDFCSEPPQNSEPILKDTFGFHPLAIDDALEETHVPKVDDWGDYLYLVLGAITFNRQAAEPLNTIELDIFLGSHYLVTLHEEPVAAIEQVWAACHQSKQHYLARGIGYLLYKLIDELVENFVPAVESMEEIIDSIEAQLFDNPAPAALEEIFSLKQSLLHVRRILLPQREVLNKLARDPYRVVKEKDRVFFRDVYDHLVRLHDLTENMRELLGSALNTYLSVINNRMNDVMKTLTIFTALFMPLSFIVGFFGMNFFQPVSPLTLWTDQPAFILTMVAIMLLPVAMYLWIRRRGWM